MENNQFNEFDPFGKIPDEQSKAEQTPKDTPEQNPVNYPNSPHQAGGVPQPNMAFEQNAAPKQNFASSNHPIPPHAPTPPQFGYYYAPPQKPKKEKKRVSFGALVACCLACAVISGGITSTAVLYGSGYLKSGGTNSGANTVINVDKNTTNAVSAIAQKVVPSVVGIKVTASVNDFFGFAQESSSEGSGVIYTSNGYIITNYHVISQAVTSQSATKLSVYLPSDPKTAIEAKVIGYNSDFDLAVIKIDKTGLTAIEFEDSDKLQVGELAVAIGNPGGLDYMSSVSSGIISGLNRTIQIEGVSDMKLIQTDAAINPGNSGGALVNYEGKLVGINSSKISAESYEGMGFAIPTNTVKKICKNIIENKDTKYAYLGITISTQYSGDVLKSMGYPAGAVVESVAQNSPAAKVGIASSDIITAFDKVAINDYTAYNTERKKHKPGEKVTLKIYRSGQYYDVSLTLGESDN